MKRMLKLLVTISFVISICLISLTSSAHNTVQSGFIVWGEDVGWRIREGTALPVHTNGTQIAYDICNSLDYYHGHGGDMIRPLNEVISRGATTWNSHGIVSIARNGPGPRGIIKESFIANSNVIARVDSERYNSSGHFIVDDFSIHGVYSWEMLINSNGYLPQRTTHLIIAHEFGHIIGLADLYNDNNSDKLMFHSTQGWEATGPTVADRNGARVITGQHVHTSTSFPTTIRQLTGNRHASACTDCGAFNSLGIVGCNTNGRLQIPGNADEHRRTCLDCGRHRDTQGHINFSWNRADNEFHRRTCNGTGACGFSQTQRHSMSAWTNTTNGHSRSCTASCGESENHTFSSNWTRTADIHYYACNTSSCIIRSNSGNHSRNYTTNGIHTHTVRCSTCSYAPQEGHTPSSAWSRDNNEHWRMCAMGCGQALNKAFHSKNYTTNGIHTHTVRCSTCSYAPQEGHDWNPNNTCRQCGQRR